MSRLFLTLQDEIEQLEKETGTKTGWKHVPGWKFELQFWGWLFALHIPLITKAIIINA